MSTVATIDPATIRTARQTAANEYHDLCLWLAKPRSETGLRYVEYQRERAAKLHRQQQLNESLRTLNSQLNSAAADLEERGVDLGDRLRGCMFRFEQLQESDNG